MPKNSSPGTNIAACICIVCIMAHQLHHTYKVRVSTLSSRQFWVNPVSGVTGQHLSHNKQSAADSVCAG